MFKKLWFLDGLILEAKDMFDELKELDKKMIIQRLSVYRKIFDFNIFKRLTDFIKNIYFHDISLKQARDKQEEKKYLDRSLKSYKPRNLEKIKSRAEVLKTHSQV